MASDGQARRVVSLRHADGGGWAKCDRCNVFGMDHSSDKVMAGYMDRHDKARHNERGSK